MSRRQEIALALLEVLAGAEGPLDEAVAHYGVNARVSPEAMVSEFFEALRWCEAEGWVTGVRNALRGPRWMITDKGRAQRHV